MENLQNMHTRKRALDIHKKSPVYFNKRVFDVSKKNVYMCQQKSLPRESRKRALDIHKRANKGYPQKSQEQMSTKEPIRAAKEPWISTKEPI